MWIVSGPFDSEVSGEISFQKSKLLKTSSKYVLGRKDDCGLVINHKRVSKSNAEFIVGNFSQDDVRNPTTVPKLELCNTKDKILLISRGSDTLSINPSATQEVQDGDIITIARDIGITVNWIRVSCFSPVVRGKPVVSLERCASLGISVTSSSSPENTHHLVSNYAVNACIAASLISATQLVKPEWLDELIRLGTLSVQNGGITCTSLEKTFLLPPIAKFRPAYPASLPHPLKSVNVWEPNEERLSLFRRYIFIFMIDTSAEVEGFMKDLVIRGHGRCESFHVTEGRAKWHQALSKGKRRLSQSDSGGALVLVGDHKAVIDRIGNQAWTELVIESNSFGLHCIPKEKVLDAVLYVDVSHIDCSGPAVDDEEASPLPSFVPNTHSNEPSIPPDQEETNASRNNQSIPGSTSTGTSREAPDLLNLAIPPPPRKPLVRRTKAARSAIIGIDDVSVGIETVAEDPSNETPATCAEPAKVTPFDLSAPIPARSSRLKRRDVNAAPSSSQFLSSLSDDQAEREKEPPLKKFKALFESSDPDKLSQDDFSPGLGTFSTDGPTSQRQVEANIWNTSDIQHNSGPVGRGGQLDPIAEGQEEGKDSTENPKGVKRKANMDGATLDDATKRAKKQALDDGNATKFCAKDDTSGESAALKDANSRLKKRPGAAPGQPDTDAAFLKALASTKRGKKSEDSFDREFNQLKISKPNLQVSGGEEECAVLADFGEDKNMRGNFMVILEMDVHQTGQRLKRANAGRSEWQTRPNFKKFKRKMGPGGKQKVELVPTQESDYGVGPAYWKRKKSRSQAQSQSQGNVKSTIHEKLAQKASASENLPSRRRALLNSDAEGVLERTAPPRGPLHPLPTVSSAPASAPDDKAEPLFLDDDEDGRRMPPLPEIAILDTQDKDATLESSVSLKSRSRKPSRRATKEVTVHADSDDEGATFKGFRGRSTRSRR